MLPNEASPRPGDTAYAYPFFGTLDADLISIGATAPGDIGSLDPMQPGVLVIERLADTSSKPGRILLRLGSLANRRDVVRFDGGYTVLRVRELDADGIRGELGERVADAEGTRTLLRHQGRVRVALSTGMTDGGRLQSEAARRLLMEAQGIEPWSE